MRSLPQPLGGSTAHAARSPWSWVRSQTRFPEGSPDGQGDASVRLGNKKKREAATKPSSLGYVLSFSEMCLKPESKNALHLIRAVVNLPLSFWIVSDVLVYLTMSPPPPFKAHDLI